MVSTHQVIGRKANARNTTLQYEGKTNFWPNFTIFQILRPIFMLDMIDLVLFLANTVLKPTKFKKNVQKPPKK